LAKGWQRCRRWIFPANQGDPWKSRKPGDSGARDIEIRSATPLRVKRLTQADGRAVVHERVFLERLVGSLTPRTDG